MPKNTDIEKYLSQQYQSQKVPMAKFTNTKGEYALQIKSGTIEMKENKVIILAD